MAARVLCILSLVFIATCSLNKGAFSGTYQMDNGTMVLVQVGDKVTGTYTGEETGTIEGTVKDGKLSYEWKQPNGEAGRGVFTLSADGKEISGTWGNGQSETDGGTWKGKKIK